MPNILRNRHLYIFFFFKSRISIQHFPLCQLLYSHPCFHLHFHPCFHLHLDSNVSSRDFSSLISLGFISYNTYCVLFLLSLFFFYYYTYIVFIYYNIIYYIISCVLYFCNVHFNNLFTILLRALDVCEYFRLLYPYYIFSLSFYQYYPEMLFLYIFPTYSA